jgi:hypothetical protein
MYNVNTLKLAYDNVTDINNRYVILKTGDKTLIADILHETTIPVKEAVLSGSRLGIKVEYQSGKDLVCIDIVLSEFDLLTDIQSRIGMEINIDRINKKCYAEVMNFSGVK